MSPYNRRDTNQKDILRCLERNNYFYSVTADLKKGFPDILVESHSGIWVLFEIKHDNETLTPDEQAFKDKFGSAACHKIESCEELLMIMRHYDCQTIILWRDRVIERSEI